METEDYYDLRDLVEFYRRGKGGKPQADETAKAVRSREERDAEAGVGVDAHEMPDGLGDVNGDGEGSLGGESDFESGIDAESDDTDTSE